jgi:excinuclease ABC subunit C
VTGPDDYASLAEVLTRRFEHGKKEIEAAETEGGKLTSFSKFPDIIMMDGGRGQVNVCLEVFERLGIDIRVCGLVKDDSHRTRGIYYNNIEVPIDTSSEAFKLITRVQDEVHRFAIEYHRMLRSKEQVHSILDDIEGIGPTRRRALMKHFTSLEAVRSASVEELENCESMNRASAEAVYAFFREKEKD